MCVAFIPQWQGNRINLNVHLLMNVYWNGGIHNNGIVLLYKGK